MVDFAFRIMHTGYAAVLTWRGQRAVRAMGSSCVLLVDAEPWLFFRSLIPPGIPEKTRRTQLLYWINTIIMNETQKLPQRWGSFSTSQLDRPEAEALLPRTRRSITYPLDQYKTPLLAGGPFI
jgi:hypothetical protein